MKRIDLLVRVLKYGSFIIIGAVIGIITLLLTNITSNISPLISPIVSLVVGFSIPIITTFIFQKPKLAIEIGSIQRKISDNTKIFIDNYSEFSVLKETNNVLSHRRIYFPDVGSYNLNPVNGLSIVELEDLISMAQKELKELPETVEKRKQTYERLEQMNITDFKIYDADKLNEPLGPEVDFERRVFEENKADILQQFKDRYKEMYDQVDKRYSQLNNAMPVIERKLEQIKNDISAQRSFFSISTTLMNSGRLNTSVRKPALLRVYIGQGNYIDLKLTMKDFENKSDINLQSTKVVEFESSEISALPEDDRKLINTYWGQSVSAILYIEDIYSNIHSSNTISFAEGLYQKLIYDELSIAAGKTMQNR